MTLASDNIFPKVILVEGAAPSSPSASDFKLYVDSADHLLKMKNSAGTVTTFGTGLSDPMTTRGDIIYRNSSNSTARLPIGASGKVLSSDGTDVSWQTPSSGGAITFLETHTASTSATLDFTTFISSTYDEYVFEFINVLPATTNTELWMRVGTGAGPTYDSGSTYSFGNFRFSQAGSAVTGATPGSPTTQWDLSGSGGVSNSANYGLYGTVRLFDPQSAVYKKIRGEFGYLSNGNEPLASNISGMYLSTTALTAIRFLFSSGNIASGTIRVYGIAKS